MLLRNYSEPVVERGGLIVGLFFFCTLAFGVDIAVEIAFEINENHQTSYAEAIHFLVEVIAEIGLIAATWLSFTSYLSLRNASRKAYDTAHNLRTGFDKIINQKFEKWQLTKSERDVGLLAIRGLTIIEIAEQRKSKEGTIKAHLHNLYAKAGISSRTDLLAMLMDEVLSSDELYIS